MNSNLEMRGWFLSFSAWPLGACILTLMVHLHERVVDLWLVPEMLRPIAIEPARAESTCLPWTVDNNLEYDNNLDV
jgi:hypothetical protein